MIGQKFQRIYQSFAIIFNRVIADFVHKTKILFYSEICKYKQTSKQTSKQINQKKICFIADQQYIPGAYLALL